VVDAHDLPGSVLYVEHRIQLPLWLGEIADGALLGVDQAVHFLHPPPATSQKPTSFVGLFGARMVDYLQHVM
jgi:hypothetical protein